MKKFGTLLLALLLCFSIVGCSNKKSTADITKILREAGYTISYNNKDIDENITDTTVSINETKNGKFLNQFIYYIIDDKIDTAAFIQSPEKEEDYDNMIIGFIYTDEESKSEINDKAKKAAEKILKKLDLTIDDLVDYSLDIHKDKGKSLEKK